MSDKPIELRDYITGVNVVDIGDLRIARGITRRPFSACRHVQLFYDNHERRIWCADCESEIEPFDAFEIAVAQWSNATDKFNKRQKLIEEAEAFSIRRRATKVFDDAWMSAKTIPNCPHCDRGILPEDVLGGVSTSCKKWAQRRKKRDSI